MAWDNITGDQRIVPTSGGSNANEVRFENGKPKKLRLLMGADEQPYSYLEHTAEVDVIENGQQKHLFRTIRCAKTTKNPNAYCPLCDGQQLKRRARNTANVWDYETNSVQKLNAGDVVWKPIATTRKLGVDVLGVDWVVMKSGEGRNDTEYATTNLGVTPFTLPADTVLFDIEQEYAPNTIEEMQSIIESIGLTWAQVITPPELSFPTLQTALAHVMPNGKYKDQSFQQIWDADPTSKGMINFLATKSDRVTPEKAAAQVIMVNLGGANIAGVPKGGTGGTIIATTSPAPVTPIASSPVNVAPAPIAPTPVTPVTPVIATPVGVVSGDRQSKINTINGLLSTNEKFVKGGFTMIIETMQKASDGKTNITDFTDVELDKMLAICNE